MDLKSKIILISGPTASGKSKFALKLAKKIDGEIINADSMQIFKEIKILNARPSSKDKSNIKHHLYGFLSVKKNFSVGEWLKKCLTKISEIKKRKKVPIIVGGTGLYFKSLVDGLAKIPKISKNNRDKIRKLQKKIGQKSFYKRLIKLDPLCKNYINTNDQNRSIRAYEVFIQTNKSLYTWFKNTAIHFQDKDFEKIFIDISRDEVLKSLSNRIEKMIKAGAIQEVKKFNKLKVKKTNSSFKIIGIREINELKPDKTNLSLIKEKITIKTRQYAKRQMTWARGHMKDWYRIAPNNLNSYLNKIS
ncbi:tRNA (adenosine(37)-N6)-dimethylallyltransferase MiaA [Candidatus Pelagibacter communis]|uniref:tRNA (adenosine(37)-N6)-dimethylallyltransferase MiaA n=1 Tax=Pelagibacter ubique TaxID=198252 RepID=UPI00094C7AC5|nr:tRNA (adenosine(37)-N6)-dimethylallyltransferase MiaA [Candidatus Pelagibacter ubique]